MAKSILAKTGTGEIQLTITIATDEVKKSYEQALEEIVKETEIPGFRKGKAPKKLVEEKIDKSKVYEKVLQRLVPKVYIEAVKEHNLKPILTPKVELLKAKEGEDWEIRATTCETPEVHLGRYKEEIRKALAPTKIWVPHKKPATTETRNSQEGTEDEKTQKVIQKLLEIVKVDLPEMLMEDEVKRALSNLINQTNTLGLTIDQYLNSINKSAEQLRAEYRERIVNDLKLQFSLDKVAEEEKIQVSDKEIDDLISSTGDKNLKENLNTPLQRAYLKGILLRRRSLEFLTKL
ncbi:MAG: trigger factor [Patescibacteria group bacterium]